MTDTPRFLLFKHRRDGRNCALYWRPNGEGYTPLKAEAGRWTIEQTEGRRSAETAMVRETDAPDLASDCTVELCIASLDAELEAVFEEILEKGPKVLELLRRRRGEA